jgi:DNA-binding response OmpR family regulator
LVVIGEVEDVELASACQALAGRVPVLVVSRENDCRKCQARAACGALSVPPPLEPGALLDLAGQAQSAARLWRSRVTTGPLTLALDTDEVLVRDEPRPNVRDILFRLLRYLALRPERPVPFAELQRHVWNARVARTTILSHLSRLRTALGCPDVRIVVVGDTCTLRLEPRRNGFSDAQSGLLASTPTQRT